MSANINRIEFKTVLNLLKAGVIFQLLLFVRNLNQTCQSVSVPACLSACLPVCQYASMPVCQYASISVCQSASLPICQSANLPVCQSASMPVCLSDWKHACTSVCMFIHPSKNFLQQAGRSLDRVFHSRSGCVHAMQLHRLETKPANLKLKTRTNNL